MHLLCTGDWQATVSNLDRCQLTLEQILDCIRKYKVDYVIHGGDFKEDTNPVDQRVTNFLIDATRQITRLCPLLANRGNHDLIATRDGVPSCLPVLEASGAKVFNTVGRYPISSGTEAFFVPYIRDKETELEAFRQAAVMARASQMKHKLLFFHTGVAGCLESSTGHQGSGISENDLGAHLYTLCIGAHIHRPQQLGNNILFVGSPFSQDWGECNQDKRLLLIDTGSMLVSNISSAIPGWYDPSLPNYEPPDDWVGTHVRIHVPVGTDPAKDITEAREKAGNDHPGAHIHIVPSVISLESPDSLPHQKSDNDWIDAYLKTLPITEETRMEVLTMLPRFLSSGGLLGLAPIVFLETTGSNVLSFKNIHLDLTQKGLILVTGRRLDWPGRSNGAGKSAALGLPVLAITGETPKGQKHDAWVHNDKSGKKLPSAQLVQTLRLSDGKILRIERGRKPPVLKVFLDDRDISLGDLNQTQKLIEKLTGLTHEVMTNSLYIGQQEIGSVFGTEKERKELFSRLLGLERFLTAQEKIRKVMLQHQQSVAEWNGELAGVSAVLQEVGQEVQQLTAELREVPKVTKGQFRELQTEREARKKELFNLKKKQEEITQVWLPKNQKRFNRWLDLTLAAEAKSEEYGKILEETVKVSGTCPVCGSTVRQESLEKYSNDLEAKIRKADETAETYQSLQNENLRLREKKTKVLNDYRRRAEKIQDSLRELDKMFHNMQGQKEAHDQLKARLQAKVRRQSELEKKYKLYDAARSWTLEQHSFLELCCNIVGRDGLPTYLCSLIVPRLNQTTRIYSEIFTEGEISVQFECSEGDVDIQVQNLHGGKDIGDQSRGEGRLAGAIAAFAFRDALVPFNFLIVDEPSEGLDSVNARNFALGIKQVIGRFNSVWLVSHNDHILATLEPDAHYEVLKKDMVSTLKRVE